MKMNLNKINGVMKEFNHLTKDLWWKDENKKQRFGSLNEIEAEILEFWKKDKTFEKKKIS